MSNATQSALMSNATQSVADEHADLWWQPRGKTLGIILALTAMLSFGSFQNLQKSAGKLSPLHFFADLSIGQAAVAVLLFEGPGRGVLINMHVHRVIMACFGGFLHGLANLFLTVGVKMAGLSIALPICNGLALTIGTIQTYWLDRRGQLPCVIAGVFLAFIAVLSQALTYQSLKEDQDSAKKGKGVQDAPSDKVASAESLLTLAEDDARRRKAVAVCVISGVIMAVRTPMYTYSMQPQVGLTPYAGEMLFTISAVFACVPGFSFEFFQPDGVHENYLDLPLQRHLWGFAAGCIYSVGLACSFLCGEDLGFALSHCVGMSSSLVAILWGIIFYYEFAGSSWSTRLLAASAIALYVGAVFVLLVGVDA